ALKYERRLPLHCLREKDGRPKDKDDDRIDNKEAYVLSLSAQQARNGEIDETPLPLNPGYHGASLSLSGPFRTSRLGSVQERRGGPGRRNEGPPATGFSCIAPP